MKKRINVLSITRHSFALGPVTDELIEAIEEECSYHCCEVERDAYGYDNAIRVTSSYACPGDLGDYDNDVFFAFYGLVTGLLKDYELVSESVISNRPTSLNLRYIAGVDRIKGRDMVYLFFRDTDTVLEQQLLDFERLILNLIMVCDFTYRIEHIVEEGEFIGIGIHYDADKYFNYGNVMTLFSALTDSTYNIYFGGSMPDVQ